LTGKKIIVTGGAGFLGKHIVSQLETQDNEVFVPRSAEHNLESKDETNRMYEKCLSDWGKIDIVIHAATDIGGIGYSSSHSASQFYSNTLINLNTVHGAYQYEVGQFVGIGSVCEYPAVTPCPFKEEELWNGYPVISNDAYGLTKRMLLAQCVAYERQYGFHFVHLLPVNMYGPGDDFDLANSHVIPALIRKIAYAIDHGQNSVEVWGTGYESREFIYIEDVAEAVIMAAEKYESGAPVNIGSGQEIQMKELANILKELMNYKGEFRYLDNGLGGQVRRLLDVSKAEKEFGFRAKTDFYVGLEKTIKAFYENRERIENGGE
jgi:Nucleoside-diphosphate-sugar epimerases